MTLDRPKAILAALSITAGMIPSLSSSALGFDDWIPLEVIEALHDAEDHLPDGDDYGGLPSPFQRKASSVLRMIEQQTRVTIDWNRVDLASNKIRPTEFPFSQGTALEALSVYSQWTGLLVSEGRLGKIYALNPDANESHRVPRRAILSASEDRGHLLVLTDKEGWLPVLIGDVDFSRNTELQIETAFAHIDEEHLRQALDYIHSLDVGDVVDLSGSQINGVSLPVDLMQLTGIHLQFGARGRGGSQTSTFVAAATMQTLLGQTYPVYNDL